MRETVLAIWYDRLGSASTGDPAAPAPRAA